MPRSPELYPLPLPEAIPGVEVLVGSLTTTERRGGLLRNLLNDEERARAARFHFERDQRRYVAARGLLRELLGERLGLDPAALRLRVGPHGKPALAGGPGALRFNVSHSGDRALFALADGGREVGVDLESAARLGDARDLPALAARTLTPADLARWRDLPEAGRPGAFLRAWTRLEAYGKATGEGLGQVLGRRSVLFETDLPGWRPFDLPVGEGWAGALVVESPPG